MNELLHLYINNEVNLFPEGENAAILNAGEKWTRPINNWGQTMMQLSIHFPGRLDKVMSL